MSWATLEETSKRTHLHANWTIRAVIYTLKYGNYKHWALCAEHEETEVSYFFEVIGSHGDFRRNISNDVLENSCRVVESIYIGEFADREFENLKQIVQATEADNETLEWDCQDYVLEMVDNLEEECLLDGDDKSYQKQKRKLERKRGPD